MTDMENIKTRTAGDIMRRSLVFVRPNQELAEAERLLVDNHISGMPVIEQNKLVGMLSRSDLSRARVLAQALDGQIRDELHWDETQADGFRHADPERFESVSQRYASLRVRDVMRSQVVTCEAATPVSKVAELLLQHHIHRIIVVEGERPVGIISSLDLVKLLAG
jgi:CBS domain-containing protein